MFCQWQLATTPIHLYGFYLSTVATPYCIVSQLAPPTSVNTHSIGVTWRGLDPCFVQNISKVETTLKNLQHGAKVGVLCCHVTTSTVLQPLVAPVKGGNIITSHLQIVCRCRTNQLLFHARWDGTMCKKALTKRNRNLFVASSWSILAQASRVDPIMDNKKTDKLFTRLNRKRAGNHQTWQRTALNVWRKSCAWNPNNVNQWLFPKWVVVAWDIDDKSILGLASRIQSMWLFTEHKEMYSGMLGRYSSFSLVCCWHWRLFHHYTKSAP